MSVLVTACVISEVKSIFPPPLIEYRICSALCLSLTHKSESCKIKFLPTSDSIKVVYTTSDCYVFMLNRSPVGFFLVLIV